VDLYIKNRFPNVTAQHNGHFMRAGKALFYPGQREKENSRMDLLIPGKIKAPAP